MSEPETIEEYIESLRPLPVGHLEWMATHIDKERFPERYKAIIDAISQKRLQPPTEEQSPPKVVITVNVPQTWKFKDLLLVSIIVFLFSSLMIPMGDIVFHSEKVGKYLFLFLGCFLSSIIPILWIKKYYNAGKEALGLKRGRLSLKFTILVGVGAGLIYVLFWLLFRGGTSAINRLSFSGFLKSLPLLSADGFIIVILGPISEEIYIRGFLYGYLKPKLGLKFGLLIQALVFAFLHFSAAVPIPTFSPVRAFEGFVVGLLCGVLYETSDSLYPSMISHSTVNYLSLMFQISQVSG